MATSAHSKKQHEDTSKAKDETKMSTIPSPQAVFNSDAVVDGHNVCSVIKNWVLVTPAIYCAREHMPHKERSALSRLVYGAYKKMPRKQFTFVRASSGGHKTACATDAQFAKPVPAGSSKC